MKFVLKFIIIIALLISCKSDDNLPSCSFENPIEDLVWLKQKVDELNNSKHKEIINQASYKNQTVFVFSICCYSCNTVITVYNCSGEKIGYIGGDNEVSWDDISDSKKIWESEGECL